MPFSDSVYEWGLSVIRCAQQLPLPFFAGMMKTVSFFGDVPFYVVAAAVLFWLVDRRYGFRMMMLLIFSAGVNTGLKNLFQVPRPYLRDPFVGLDSVSGFSTPSGHAQLSAAFWPMFSVCFISRKRRFFVRILAALLPPLVIGFSRVALGVHYPTDVLLGWLLGLLAALGFILFWGMAVPFFCSLPRMVKILLAAVLSGLFNMTGLVNVEISGIMFGLSAGYILLLEGCRYDAASGTVLQKLLRLVLGLALVLGIYCSLRFAVLPAVMPYFGAQQELMQFAQAVAAGFCISFVVPHLSVKMGLAQTEPCPQAGA